MCCVQEATELKDSHTATDTQLPTATSDHSRTLSELHHNDEESAPVLMYLFFSLGTPLTVKHLVAACKRVSDWHRLGIQLDLTISQLKNILLTYRAHGVDRLKAEMFDLWLKSSLNPSWSDLITALRAMGEDTVASDIAAGGIVIKMNLF